jgi:hypothetical protein
MFIKKIASVGRIAFLLSSLSCAIMAVHHHPMHDVDVTVTRLHNDTLDIRKYIMDRVHNDLKKAKRFGKGAAHFFAGISHYAFDAIPFEFFVDNRAIDTVFKRLEEGSFYIQETKELFKRNYMGNKRKLNQSQLAEFLYNRVVDRITVTDEQRAILRREPIKMDEFVRRGIVKRDEYMYYTLLNFVVRYYLEHEIKK